MSSTQISPERINKMMNHSICRRAALMHSLLTIYDLYESIESLKKCLNIDFTYEQAEQFAYLLGSMTEIDVPPSTFLYNKNQMSDELLDNYRKLQTMLGHLDQTIRSITESFLRRLYYTEKFPNGHAYTLLIGVTAFLDYSLGRKNKQELKDNFILMDLAKAKLRVVDSRYARHDLIQLETIFNEIYDKRIERLRKKSVGSWTDTHINLSL